MALKEGLKALEKIVDTLIARDDSGMLIIHIITHFMY